MQRIIISESDLTSNVEIMSSYDVAYVPGFMSASDNQLEKYYRKPTLFTNKYDFLSIIGNIAPKFAEAQPYPAFVNGEQNGFTKKAIPADGIMFPAGDADLGYRIALYLLNLGIPVYYEVMNNTLQGDLATYYTYKKVDLNGGDTFIDGLSYYEMTEGHSSDSTVSVTNTDISPVPSVTKATFITKVGSENTGFYTFTGVATGNVVSWTVNGGDTTITAAQMTEQYGISFTGWTPVDGETYNITSGATLTFGNYMDVSDSLTVTIVAKDSNNVETEKQFVYRRIPAPTIYTVTLTKPTGWGNTIYAYMYGEGGSPSDYTPYWYGDSIGTPVVLAWANNVSANEKVRLKIKYINAVTP